MPDTDVTMDEAEKRRLGEYAIKQFHDTVYSIVNRLKRQGRLPPDMDTEDLAQELTIHLYRKFHKYDPARGIKEITFVMHILKRRAESVLTKHHRRGFKNVPSTLTPTGQRCEGAAGVVAEYDDESGMATTEDVQKAFARTEWTEADWRSVLSRIPNRRWRECVEMYYRFGFTLGSIAFFQGRVSVERVRQLINCGVISLSTRRHLYDGDDFPAASHSPLKEHLERSSTAIPDVAEPASPLKRDLFSDWRPTPCRNRTSKARTKPSVACTARR